MSEVATIVREWWELPDAEPNRPMTLEEGAKYLHIGPPRHKDPEQTIRRWIYRGKLGCIRVGNEPRLTLNILRKYVTRDLVPERKARR